MKRGRSTTLSLVLAEGEGQRVEFKQRFGRLDRELVATANASGGSIFLGVDDHNEVSGFTLTNEIRSQIQDIANNCDPGIPLTLKAHPEGVLELVVPEGADKPYQCRDGFFLRVGPNTQKLTRGQITEMVLATGAHHFDETVNGRFRFPRDFDRARWSQFLRRAGIEHRAPVEQILMSLDLVQPAGGQLRFRQAGVLFFAKDPQQFLKESHITCVRYDGQDRYQVLDRLEAMGDPISMLEEAAAFVRRNTSTRDVVTGDARRRELSEYPHVALREALVNAVMHRDYYYDGSHTYVHIYSNRMEIENPGGLPPGMTPEDLGKRSVRRNRTIADLLFRAKFVEKIGSGIQRMQRALEDNGNPPMEISATNFFVVRLYPRIHASSDISLTARQTQVVRRLQERGSMGKADIAVLLGVSGDTALREIRVLLEAGLIRKSGVGKGTTYTLREDTR